MVPAKRRAPLVGTVTDNVEEAGIVTPLSRMLEHADTDAATFAKAVTVQVVPPTPEPPARVLMMVPPTPVWIVEAAVVEAVVVMVENELVVEVVKADLVVEVAKVVDLVVD
jgi:hypothetical protein